MFKSNNITITGKSAVLSILYTVVTRQNKQPKEIKTHTHTHTHTHSSSPPYKNDTRIKPEAQKAKQPPPPHYLKPVESKACPMTQQRGFCSLF